MSTDFAAFARRDTRGNYVMVGTSVNHIGIVIQDKFVILGPVLFNKNCIVL